jgi:hypothetical protein
MWGSDKSFGSDQYLPSGNTARAMEMQQDFQASFANTLCSILALPLELIGPSKDLGRTFEYRASAHPNGKESHGISGPRRRRVFHIVAERKRRHNQRFLYDQLSSIIAASDQGPRLTRSELLFRTADWLKQLIADNKRLKTQLLELSLHR